MIETLFARAGVRYEVAVDALGALNTLYSETIAVERDKPSPDEAVIERARHEKDALRALREELDPTDEGAIERVIALYGDRARTAYAH